MFRSAHQSTMNYNPTQRKSTIAIVLFFGGWVALAAILIPNQWRFDGWWSFHVTPLLDRYWWAIPILFFHESFALLGFGVWLHSFKSASPPRSRPPAGRSR